jgi:DNA-3-methyladenine glycosylase I
MRRACHCFAGKEAEMTEEPRRCDWAGSDPLYRSYHDNEWGGPVTDDNRLFEKIALEGFQSGLSWLTILKKRERFREVFHGFDPRRVANMGEPDIDRLLADPGIIRHRGKIASTINNAAHVLAIQAEFGSFSNYIWAFEPGAASRPATITREIVAAMPATDASKALSKDLKKRGFSFVGPTTCYAFMQAMGLVNDHFEGCFCRPAVEAERRALVRPAVASS